MLIANDSLLLWSATCSLARGVCATLLVYVLENLHYCKNNLSKPSSLFFSIRGYNATNVPKWALTSEFAVCMSGPLRCPEIVFLKCEQ